MTDFLHMPLEELSETLKGNIDNHIEYLLQLIQELERIFKNIEDRKFVQKLMKPYYKRLAKCYKIKFKSI